ncbi:hypothetical protein P4O66_000881 [Electrophorus voltai]|uniref:Microtubule-associated protein 1B/S N-terminal domain-containing protein n=1 Tax=Electrophorus voltai TaxID=2609070 RepID=A0AAD8ZEB4_9TELE|nr:hypothetical protein P4O66_000881 [Electrophorus voltai]
MKLIFTSHPTSSEIEQVSFKTMVSIQMILIGATFSLSIIFTYCDDSLDTYSLQTAVKTQEEKDLIETLQAVLDKLKSKQLPNTVKKFGQLPSVHSLMWDTSQHKLLVLVGQSLEDTGDVVLHTGHFSPNQFTQIFADEKIRPILDSINTSSKASLTLSCPKIGKWKNSVLGKHSTQDIIDIKAASTVDLEFFCRLRSSCYIISGDDTIKEAMIRSVLDALLDGKSTWPDHVPVTLIPTFESVIIHEWYQQTRDRQRQLGITVLGSNSTVAMQEETFPACKVEFTFSP